MAGKLEAIEAEVLPDECVTAMLCDEPLRVLPRRQWRASSIRAVAEGNLDLWAEKSLAEGEYAKWQEIDPTVDEMEAFFRSWQDRGGQDDVGKSRASSTSSRRTARR